jgi:hypothetical protein
MQTLAENHFAVLTAVAAPAVLTNASSVLCLGLGNRIARVIDRTRTVATAMANEKPNTELHGQLSMQFNLLRRRAKYLTHALRLGYAALGGFAAEALIAVIGALLDFEHVTLSRVAAVIALLIGVLSVAAFVTSCVYMVRETMAALDNLESEAKTLMMFATVEKKALGL